MHSLSGHTSIEIMIAEHLGPPHQDHVSIQALENRSTEAPQ